MRNVKTLICSLSASCILLPSLAVAQDSETSIERVTVTAQKREQFVLDVPVTMDVIQGEFLDRTNTTELDDLSRFLPNVVIQEQGASLPSFNIRGITDDSASVTTTPRISVYQDGIDVSKKTVASFALYDIERIEVLKGAQPTLFGVAAANGAVSTISAKPTDEFAANIRVATNTESAIDFRGMINTPINDNFSFRLATIVRQQDGFIDNLACGPDSYNPSGTISDKDGNQVSCAGGDLNGVDVTAFRATLLADFDNTTVLLRASMEENNQPGISFKSGSIAPLNGDTSPFTAAELGLGSLAGTDRELKSYDLAVTHHFTDDLALTVDAYTKDVELEEYFDADGTGLRIQDAYFENNADLSGFGARLVYTSDGPFAGFIGFSSTKDESILPFVQLEDPILRAALDAKAAELAIEYPNISLNNDISTDASIEEIEAVRSLLAASLFNQDGTPISDPTTSSTVINGPFVFEGKLDIQSYVIEGSYDINDALTATLGVRYIDESRYSKDTFYEIYSAEAEEDFTATLPRFSLNYKYSDDMSVYFNYAEGRRSPVVDVNPFGETNIVEAETVDSFDIGAKYYGKKFSLTAAVFAYTYQNFQQSFTDNQTLESVTVTVGDSAMYGFEATADYIFDDSLRIGGNIGILNARFDDNTDAGSTFDYGGNTFRLAPDFSAALFLNKSMKVGEFLVDFDWITTYQTEVFFDSSNRPDLAQGAYSITDVSVKLSKDSSQWRAELFADNLFDKEFIIDGGNTGGGFGLPTFVAGTPFIAGVRIFADF